MTSLDSSFSNLSTLQGKRAINFGCPKKIHVDSVVAIHFFPCPTDWFGSQLSNPSSFTPDLEDSCRCRCCGTHSCSLKENLDPPPSSPDHGSILRIFGRTPKHIKHFPQLHAGSKNTFRMFIKNPSFWVDFDMASHHFWWNLGMISIILVEFGYDIHDLCKFSLDFRFRSNTGDEFSTQVLELDLHLVDEANVEPERSAN